MMEQGPVLVVSFTAQQINVIHDTNGKVVEGDPVCFLLYLLTDQIVVFCLFAVLISVLRCFVLPVYFICLHFLCYFFIPGYSALRTQEFLKPLKKLDCYQYL